MHRLTARIRRDERGSALVSVVGIILVTIVIALTISATTVSSLERTDKTRDTTSADFAAEAGVAVAQNDLAAGSCNAHGPIYESGATAPPYYRSVVLKVTATGTAVDCPGDTDEARIVSTGYSSASDYTSRTGVQRTVEARFTSRPEWLEPSGAAVFAYSSQGMGGSGKLVAEDDLEPSVHVRDGNVICDGDSGGDADWVINNGSFSAQGSCNVHGNVWASKTAALSGNPTLGGNLIAESVDFGGGTISGSIWSRTDASIGHGATVDGNVTTTRNLTFKGGTVKGSGWVKGTAELRPDNVDIRGHLYATSIVGKGSGTVDGGQTVTSVVGAPNAPSVPVVAEWVDLKYDTTLWTGFTPKVLSGTCDFTALEAAIASLHGQPGVLDARGCSGALKVSDHKKLSVPADLVIYAKAFDLGGSGGFAGTNGSRLWLVNEDTGAAPNKAPDCGSQSFKISGGFTITNLTMMIYSPCQVVISSGLSLRGQIFAGAVDITGGATLTYGPSGLPGYDLDTGQPIDATLPRTLTLYTNSSTPATNWIAP
jgi:Tfp pilus assembly protein PilX